MPWEALIAGVVMVGLFSLLLWLLAEMVRWLWSALAGPGRAPEPQHTPAPAPRRTPASVQPVQARPSQTTQIRLGPAQRIRLDPSLLPPAQPGLRVRWGAPLRIPRREEALWMAKGWQRNGNNEYTGHFQVGERRWRGLIRIPYAGGYETYIWQPPLREIERNTHHRPCFRANGGNGRCKVLYHSLPTSLDHAITSVEDVLREALGVRA